MRYFELLENLYFIGKGYINLNDNPDDIARSLNQKYNSDIIQTIHKKNGKTYFWQSNWWDNPDNNPPTDKHDIVKIHKFENNPKPIDHDDLNTKEFFRIKDKSKVPWN